MELAITIKASVTNPNVGDLMLGDDGDEVVYDAGVVPSQLQLEVAQRLFIALQFFKAEWFLDETEGLPYFEKILKKDPGDRVIRSVFGQVIEKCEGVERMTSFTYTVSKERKMSIRFACVLADGSTFRSTEYSQFVVADV